MNYQVNQIALFIVSLGLPVLGGMALFYLGIRLVSLSGQILFGPLIQKLTEGTAQEQGGKDRSQLFHGVSLGFFITSIVQSVTVATTMGPGFANAHIFNFPQSFGLLIGAGLGSITMAWVMGLDARFLPLLLMSLGFLPFLFQQNQKVQQTGRFLLGLGLIFLGLFTMAKGFKNLKDFSIFFELIKFLETTSGPKTIIALILGVFLSLGLRSLLLPLGLIVAMTLGESISIPMGHLFILGINLGIAFLSFFHAKNGGRAGQRAAVAYLLSTIIAIFFMMFLYLRFIVGHDEIATPAQLAWYHTLVNILIMVIAYFTFPLLMKVTYKLVGIKEYYEGPDYSMIGDSRHHLPSTSLALLSGEVNEILEDVTTLWEKTWDYLNETKPSPKLLGSIKEYEGNIDFLRKIVIKNCEKMSERELSTIQAKKIHLYMAFANHLEKIADYLDKVAVSRTEILKLGENINQADLVEVHSYFKDVWFYYTKTVEQISNSNHTIHWDESEIAKLKGKAGSLRKLMENRMLEKQYGPVLGMLLYDMVIAIRKLRGHTQRLLIDLERSQAIKG